MGFHRKFKGSCFFSFTQICKRVGLCFSGNMNVGFSCGIIMQSLEHDGNIEPGAARNKIEPAEMEGEGEEEKGCLMQT